MLFFRGILFIFSALLLVGCSNTELFKHYGPETMVEGGPVMKVVGDLEIWEHGKPDKAYSVIGEIQDTRKSGLIYLATLDGDVAKQVVEKSGDGAFRVGYGLVPSGKRNPQLVISSAGGTPYSYVTPSTTTYARSSKYKVFKYKN